MEGRTPSLDIVFSGAATPSLTVDLPLGFDQAIGRDQPSGLTLEDPQLSRRHARLIRDGAGVWLEDLGSTNGTFVNGNRLAQRRRLREGDEVIFGSTRAVFHEPIGSPQPDRSDPYPVDPYPVDPWTMPVESGPLGTGPIGTGPGGTGPLGTGPLGTGPSWPAPVGGGSGCPRCGAVSPPQRWFCATCGQERQPIEAPQPVEAPARVPFDVATLIGSNGQARPGRFRQAMRAGNGGRRVSFSEGLAAATVVFRLSVACALLAVVVAVVVLTQDGALQSVALGA